MFKHHRLDAILVSLSLLQIRCLVLPFAIDLSILSIGMLIFLNVLLLGTNYQCIAHNFIHNPFFKNQNLNKVFSVLNTISLGIPQSIYRIHHLDHHRHNNNPEKDISSTYLHGRSGEEENIFSYSILGLLRSDLIAMYKKSLKRSSLINIEIFILTLFISTLLLLNWKLTLGYVLSSYLLGQVFALWENYCEHHFADYTDKRRDSVSCYNNIYNFVWFNNGYHQEHHYLPQVHWTQIKPIKEMLPEDRVIVNYCHLANSFSAYKGQKKGHLKVALKEA